MANEMRTYVKVKSQNPKVAERIQEIFKFDDSGKKYEADALDILNNLLGTDYSYSNETTKEDWNREVDFPDNDTWEKYIGPKWLYVEYDHSELPENSIIVLRTAWSVPVNFLSIFRDELQKIDPTCYITGTYEDEGYDPCGAFVYGEFDYDDIEDYDDVFDWDEYEEDDFYLENFHEELFQLEKDVEQAYLEYLEDRKNNPQDYE